MAQSIEPNIADLANSWLKKHQLNYKLEQEPLNDEIDKALRYYHSKNDGKGGNRPDAKLLLKTKALEYFPVLIEYKGYKDKLEKLDASGRVENLTAKNEPHFKNIRDYAVNGAVHYATAILHHTSYTDIIAIGMTGFTGDKIKIFKPKKNIKFDKDIAQFFISVLKKSFSSFSWGNSSFNVAILNSTKIQLPTITENGKPQIAFDFMEQFIATLNAYLMATGLKDYALTNDEQAALDGLNTVSWGEFKIGDLFEKLNLRNHNKLFNKLIDTSTTRTDEFNLPLINAKLGDNGIMFYGREKDFDSAEMTIDVISNGAVATGTVYAQPYKVGVLWDAYLLKVKNQKMSKLKLLYMTATLQKSIKTKFGWDDKAVWSKVQHENISLPTKSDNTPDYDYMSMVISAMQKVVIKNVVLYADKQIAATEKIINQGNE